MRSLAFASIAAATVFVSGCSSGPSPVPVQLSSQPPAAPREFRAAWVATVDNIDWPSKKGLPVTQQRAEIVAICDRAVELKLNCLIVQVRTTCDALYPSKLEPWSNYITGRQGEPPAPFYDPLQMWITEAHQRGIELHAWFNPYRASNTRAQKPFAPSHVSTREPSIVREYGPQLWLDPGEADSVKQTLAVFDDVVRRYDIDGVHVDDYFYPYKIKVSWEQDNKNDEPNEAEKKARAARPNLPFPDDVSWAKYKQTHPVQPNPATKPADVDRVARDNWRRDNVNKLIYAIYTNTKNAKPWVKVGIAPFGIGRPGTAPGIKGFDQYDELYADAAMWLRNGWCDYFSPQLYWPIAKKEQSFPVLLDYWRSENKQGRHIWPGIYTAKVGEGGEKAYPAQEVVDEINVTRARPDAGQVHFSMKVLQDENNPKRPQRAQLISTLEQQTYNYDALIPATPWLDHTPPPKPNISAKHDGDAVELTLSPGSGEKTWLFGIWRAVGNDWQFHVAPGIVKTIRLPSDTTAVVVTAVDRCGNESERVVSGVK